MGNAANSQSHRSKSEDYQLVVQLTESKRLMRSKATQRLSVVIQRTFACEELLQQYVKQSKKAAALTHQFYVNAYDHQLLSLTNLCSKQFKVVEYFQHHPHTLLQEISNRSATGKHFTQKQAMSILCSCVLAMSHLSKLEALHYTLSPTDIVIDDLGICKVLCAALTQHSFDFNYQPDFYYAPQTLKIFKMQTAPNGLTNKSGVFTLGMTLLHMALLTPVAHLYNSTSYSIDYEQLNELLQRVQSVDLREVLKKMLKYHSYDRITFTQLEEMLFEVISRAEQSGQSSRAHFQLQLNPSQKLEESIVRIRNEQSYADVQTGRICQTEALGGDQEDQPNMLADIGSHPDQIVLDQSGKTNQGSHSGRKSSVSSYSQASLNKLSNYSSINPRVLTENSNFSNLKDCHTRFHSNPRQAADLFSHKENLVPNYAAKRQLSYAPQRELNFDDEDYPRYVCEELKEGRYEGYKVGKFRHGFGTFYYEQGGKYCGEWVQNRMEGKGVLYYSSGKIAYEGEWKADMLHGYGVLYNEHIEVCNEDLDFGHLEELGDQWIKYEGYFENDVKCGQGALFLSNGECFRGAFESDQPNGPGQFRNVRGETVRGFWLMGALNATN